MSQIFKDPLYWRARRLRSTSVIREMVAESSLSLSNLICPLFVVEGSKKIIDIPSMPGQYRRSIDEILKHIDSLVKLGLNSFALFPAIDEHLKSSDAKEAINENGLNQKAIREIKKRFPQVLIMSDVALDPYNSDGHDGIVDHDSGLIKNDETVEILAEMALVQAQAGSDIIGPSDMMDGRIGAIRKVLDENSFQDKLIMSYTAKYSSAFYGPFRDALDSAPKGSDKKTYQMDPRNSKEAILEMRSDEDEGADVLMVKPGLSYLDIVYRLKEQSSRPIAVYNVSGEYSMIKAAGAKGWLNEEEIILEKMYSFKRAGADIILTYFAQDVARLFGGGLRL